MKKWFIKQIFEPTIKLDEIKFDNVESDDTKSDLISEKLGKFYPAILINDYLFNKDEILKFEIDESGFLPKVKLKANFLASTKFLSFNYPKDGDILSVFIDGRDDIFKPIRCDFILTNTPSKNSNPSGSKTILNFEGFLNVPNIFTDVIVAKSGTSFKVLQDVAKDLGLGFTTNESSTNDEQVWINPNGSYKQYIEEIGKHIWKDENSFFKVFIDKYYTLNFINVENQLVYDYEVLEGMGDNVQIENFSQNKNVPKSENSHKSELVLTNDISKRDSNYYFFKSNIINNSSEISMKNGYERYISFFDRVEEKFWEIPITPIYSKEKPDNYFVLRGRVGEKVNHSKSVFTGIQNSLPDHNVHEYYKIAAEHNKINNAEVSKMMLGVSLEHFNLNLQKYGRYPVKYMVYNDPVRTSNLNLGAEDEAELVDDIKSTVAIDNFYSGFYFISSIKIKYSNKRQFEYGIYEELVLSRREWSTPV